ncbi:unnamed protein product [Brassica oleracea]
MNSSEAVETGFNYDAFNGEGSLYSQMSIRSSEEEDEESKRSKAFYGVIPSKTNTIKKLLKLNRCDTLITKKV